MANKKVVKPGFVPAPHQMTEEEMKANQARFFLQKRESFAQGILYNLCNNASSFGTAMNEPEVLVKKSIEMADLLMKGLFVDPIPEMDSIGKKEEK